MFSGTENYVSVALQNFLVEEHSRCLPWKEVRSSHLGNVWDLLWEEGGLFLMEKKP